MEQILKTKSVLVSTGNIINLNELKRKTTQNATDELTESLALTLGRSIQHDIPYDETNRLCRCRVPPSTSNGKDEQRKDLKITVKIFLQSSEPEVLTNALENVLKELETTYLELLILAFPSGSDGGPSFDDEVRTLWRVLETWSDEKKLLSIGVADLSTEQLIRLHEWARVKPSVNHVNLTSCCVMPPEMTAFAKGKGIQLLTHNDPKDILPKDQIPMIFDKLDGAQNISWSSRWVARYSAMIKGRGVIQTKGFVAMLERA